MGRRSTHTSEQLRELIIRSAHDIIAEHGLAGVSAREIARRIGYSPGTLYNLFDSLADLMLEVEALMLDALDQRLAELSESDAPDDRLNQLAQAYLSFSREHPKLWSLISQHGIPPKSAVPQWYSERIERLMGRIESALACHLPPGDTNPQALKRSARVLWAGLHGLTAFFTVDKFAGATDLPVETLVDDFVSTYLAGLKERARGGGS